MLKLIAHVNNGWIYRVYQNQTAVPYSFLYFFIFLSLQFPNITLKILSHFSQELWGLETGYTHEQWWMYLVYHKQAATAAYSPFLHFSFFFSFQRLKFFITLFSGTVRPRYWKLVTHVDCERMYRVYCCCCLFIPLFLHFSFFFFSFQTLKFFITFFLFFKKKFLQNCEA